MVERVAHCLAHLTICRLVLALVVIFILVTLLAHSILTSLEIGPAGSTLPIKQNVLQDSAAGQLPAHLEELQRIRASVNAELVELEAKRHQLLQEVSNASAHKELVRGQYSAMLRQYDELRVSIKSLQMEQEDLARRQAPYIVAPLKFLPAVGLGGIPTVGESKYCHVSTCIDHSRCSTVGKSSVFYYNPDELLDQFSAVDITANIKQTFVFLIESSPYHTFDGQSACLYLVLLGETEDGGISIRPESLYNTLIHLRYWANHGTNHLLVFIVCKHFNQTPLPARDYARAMVAHCSFTQENFRPHFDVVLPPSLGPVGGEIWQLATPILPARRQYLLSFQGELPALTSHKMYNIQAEQAVVSTLKKLQTDFLGDKLQLSFTCSSLYLLGLPGEWLLCSNTTARHVLLKQSTFSLVLAPVNTSLVATCMLNARLVEALQFGAVPVILGSHIHLPFDNILDWRRAVIQLPKARVGEVHLRLRSMSDADIVEMRRQGRLLWEGHMGSFQKIIDTLLLNLRFNMGIPSHAIQDEPSPSVFNSSFKPIIEQVSVVEQPPPEGEDFLGPVEAPFSSPQYQRNFTILQGWLSPELDPFHLYPFTPFDPVLPSESKFLGSGFGFRPIGQGEGGSGKEFNEALGGNYPREQFTIVLLTYEREAVLLDAIAHFKGLPHLNKVVVVWNSPNLPSPDLRWPDIGVPVDVIRTKRNSLNNRFLPYSVIQTEAILSIDDDAHLRHDEIIFGFRVWRENRDRLVGFPGRFHAWDMKTKHWRYNSNYTCELSMVLTGAAFFHKYYAYLYSYVMPQTIRDKVDYYMNCEDLAMNFLIAHVTRKPPVKVTSRWTFRCPGCTVALWVEDEHFSERHQCLNMLVDVYGYMPLLYTQYRADSVLFKTRIPHDKQKCFKYV